jgi:hypothetical protein
MKKKLLLSSIAVSFMYIAYFSTNIAFTNDSGSPNARTGSPGDGGNTCAISGCHTGIAVTTRNGLITSTIPAEGYTPGTKYTITATAKSSTNRNTFGFQISPQNQVGALLGSITITSPSETRVTGGGKYITHTSGGISGSAGTKTWSFDWTAPASGTGVVTFYGAFNYANGNGSTNGDSIIKTTLVVNEKSAVGISNDFASLGFQLYPNPATTFITLSNTKSFPIDEVLVVDIQGKTVKSVSVVDAGKIAIDLESLGSGVYSITVQHKGALLATQKFVKN